MDDLLKRFLGHIKHRQLFSDNDQLLLAVSGGIDSVVLAELCKQAGFSFTIAHCNFQLRGEESDGDEAFVRQLAEQYQVEFFIKKFDTEKFSLINKISIQESARKLRYEWFDQLVRNEFAGNPTHLLTAHHADDSIETLLMHFFRGTGLPGLKGIPSKTGFTRRPLLDFSKEELLEFARVHKLEFREDSSNTSSKYTRNYFRNEVLPAIEKVYPQAKKNLQDNINRFEEIGNLYELAVATIKNKLCRQNGKECHIPVKQLMGFRNLALIYEIIKEYGFSEKQIEEVEKLARSESGKYIQSPSGLFRMIRHRHWFIITPIETVESKNIIIEKEMKEVEFSLGKLTIEETTNCKLLRRSPESFGQTTNLVASLDSKGIRFPLLLRKPRTADYFYPLGMKKKKKLSRFFIDQKLSKSEKEKAWVIESDKKIVWVVGHRMDERFKLSEKTTGVLKLQLLPAE